MHCRQFGDANGAAAPRRPAEGQPAGEGRRPARVSEAELREPEPHVSRARVPARDGRGTGQFGGLRATGPLPRRDRQVLREPADRPDHRMPPGQHQRSGYSCTLKSLTAVLFEMDRPAGRLHCLLTLPHPDI